VRVERRSGVVVVVGGPVPPGADAITIGPVISVREGHEESGYLLRHETEHVQQWHRYGFAGFLMRYVGSYLVWRLRRKGHWGAYRRIPFEIEADWVARRNFRR
jgi:hypothetical protein